MQRIELVVDDRAGPGRGRLDVEPIVVLHDRGHGPPRGVEGEQRHRAVPIRKKVDRRAHPERIAVVTALPRHLDDRRVLEVGNPDRRGLAAAILLPRRLPLRMRNVSEARPVGRERGLVPARQRHHGRRSARYRHREQLGEIAGRDARRPEQHVPAVGREAERFVLAGMEGQAPRLTAGRRDHVDVGIAVVGAGKREKQAVGGIDWVGVAVPGRSPGAGPCRPRVAPTRSRRHGRRRCRSTRARGGGGAAAWRRWPCLPRARSRSRARVGTCEPSVDILCTVRAWERATGRQGSARG